MFDQCAWPDTWGGKGGGGGGGGQDRARGNHLTAECNYGGGGGGAIHFRPIQPVWERGGGDYASSATYTVGLPG